MAGSGEDHCARQRQQQVIVQHAGEQPDRNHCRTEIPGGGQLFQHIARFTKAHVMMAL